MPELVPILSKEEIHQKIEGMARRIQSDYENRQLVLIGVLKGAFIFLSDLARKLQIPVTVDFVRVSSYGSAAVSSGKIRLSHEVETDIRDKHVLIVEDIVDSGLTISYLITYFKSFAPASVEVCTLIDKRERRKENVAIRYACHVVSEGFLVGYGLDYAEQYRNLPDIFHLNF